MTGHTVVHPLYPPNHEPIETHEETLEIVGLKRAKRLLKRFRKTI